MSSLEEKAWERARALHGFDNAAREFGRPSSMCLPHELNRLRLGGERGKKLRVYLIRAHELREEVRYGGGESWLARSAGVRRGRCGRVAHALVVQEKSSEVRLEGRIPGGCKEPAQTPVGMWFESHRRRELVAVRGVQLCERNAAVGQGGPSPSVTSIPKWRLALPGGIMVRRIRERSTVPPRLRSPGELSGSGRGVGRE